MFEISATGDFAKSLAYLEKLSRVDFFGALDKAGSRGVSALRAATPVDSSVTANSWSYEVSKSRDGAEIRWTNSHVEDGVPIAIILQYGHGTGTGGYVAGRDYINPALAPIFDSIAEDVWKVVRSL